MRAVVTRVSSASVQVEGKTLGRIGQGFLILLGVGQGDGLPQAEKLAEKICGLRIFPNEQGKLDRSLEEIGGQILVISQFTLYGNCKKGRRPEFLSAARPETAQALYEEFLRLCRAKGFHVESGAFGAQMLVESVNDGPFTLVLDTSQL